MRTEIYYANEPVFSGICPTPLLSRGEEYIRNGRRWGIAENITLEGLITGCSDFSGMLEKQAHILNSFSKNFQELRIEESGSTVYSQDVVFVQGVSFPESQYSYSLPFSISLRGYPSGFFSGFYGVLDPENSFSFSQGDDDLISVNHTVSAVGFNTSEPSDALQNAINFCNNFTGIENIVSPNFISSVGIENSVLKTISKNVNRLNSSCSISETWQYDPVLGGTGLLRYSNSFNSGFENGIVESSLQGSLNGGHSVNIEALRARIATIDFYNLASTSYNSFFEGTLNPVRVSSSFTEDPLENRIDFSISFDNDPRPNPYFEDSFDLNLNQINGQKTASVSVDFLWRGNCKCNGEEGWNQLKDSANNFNYFQLASDRNSFYNWGTFLKSSPISSGISYDKENCKISVEYEYENLDLDLIPPAPLNSFQYTIQVTPALPQYSARPTICKGHYSIYDLNFVNRATYTINGSSTVEKCGSITSGELATLCMVENIASKFISGQDVILTAQSFEKNLPPDSRGFNFSYSWSAKVNPIFPSGILYV